MEERIRQIIEYYDISIRQFEQKISVSDGLIHKALARKSGLKSDTLAKILDIFPQINPDWLLLGKGEMLRVSSPEIPSDTTLSALLDRISDLAQELGRAQAENAELKKELARAEEKMAAYATAAAG
jgi:hypothetical protein